jgi:hypothetical protein
MQEKQDNYRKVLTEPIDDAGFPLESEKYDKTTPGDADDLRLDIYKSSIKTFA